MVQRKQVSSTVAWPLTSDAQLVPEEEEKRERKVTSSCNQDNPFGQMTADQTNEKCVISDRQTVGK